MVQKIVIWKSRIFEILPNFAPIFRGEGVEIEKKWSKSFRKYISRGIQIWNQIFKMFSSCVGHRGLKNVTVRGYFSIFGQFFPFLGKMRILPKNGIWGSLYHLMTSNSMQNIKKIQWHNFEQYTKKLILSNCSAHFCTFLPFLGPYRHFFRKVTTSLTSYGILSLCKKL